jgi:hypothetical protein
MKIIQWFHKPKGFFYIQSEVIFMINYFFFEFREGKAKINFSSNFYEISRRNTIYIVLRKFFTRKNSQTSHKNYKKPVHSGFLFFHKDKYLDQCK